MLSLRVLVLVQSHGIPYYEPGVSQHSLGLLDWYKSVFDSHIIFVVKKCIILVQECFCFTYYFRGSEEVHHCFVLPSCGDYLPTHFKTCLIIMVDPTTITSKEEGRRFNPAILLVEAVGN
jgi:hypothetical protein